MAIVIVKHKVENYKKWETIYKEDLHRRQAAGLKEVSHGRDVNSLNEVYIIFETIDPDRARDFLKDPELRALMEEAGVLDKPEMIILEE